MRQVEIDILNFENKIQQDRRALNDLIYQCQIQGVSQDILYGKLQNMQQEISYMEDQLGMLQKALHKELGSQTEYSGPAAGIHTTADGILPASEAGTNAAIQINSDPPVISQPQEQPVQLVQSIQPQMQPMQLQEQLVQPVRSQMQPPAEKKDLEKTFGRLWMGVIASGLVFISFIFFAVMLLPVLTDGMKIAAMFIISFLFAGVGFVKLGVDRENKFYLALCGCGVGAVYISILVSSIYFKAFNDIVLYLLVFVWAVCICCLRRMTGILFQLIGQIGITIAIFFGCAVCTAESNDVKFLMLAVFFCITSMVFLAAYRQKVLLKNAISLIFNMVNLCRFWMALVMMPDSTVLDVVVAILLLYLVSHFIFCCLCEVSGDGLDFGIATVVCTILAVRFLDILLQDVPSGELMVNIAVLVLCAISLIVAERRLHMDATVGRAVIQIFAMVFMFSAVSDMEILDRHIYLAVLMVPFLCAGFLKRNWLFKYGSMIYMLAVLFHFRIHDLEKMLWGFVYFGLLTYFMLREKAHYQSCFKLFAYCTFLIKIAMDCVYIMKLFGADSYTGQILVCIVVGGINMILSRVVQMGRNLVSGEAEQETTIILNVVHVIQMGVVLFLILLPPAEYSNFVCIPWAAALFTVNTKKIFEHKNRVAAGIYVGIKYSALLLAVLVSYDVAKVLVSVCFFAFAVICIVFGFRIQCKSIRIYGLVLSMLCVFKLTLVDVAFGGLLQLAGGFFVSGILCFAISRIYNSIDNKVKKYSG